MLSKPHSRSSGQMVHSAGTGTSLPPNFSLLSLRGAIPEGTPCQSQSFSSCVSS